jgi:hypothetical protein
LAFARLNEADNQERIHKMNILKTYTVVDEQADTFLVYWTNSPVRPGGIVKVRMLAKVEDAASAAELAAMQYLLEDKRVIGTNIVGNPQTKFFVSQGVIRKLQLKKSDKTHLAPYANFLITRFAGCQMVVEKDARWFSGLSLDEMEELIVREPRRETINITGIGDVSITQHVLERISERLLPDNQTKTCRRVWKKLHEVASDPMVKEVTRSDAWIAAKYAQRNKHEGRYFYNRRLNLIMVVTDNPGEGKRLVTAFPANKLFSPFPLAA